MFLASLSPIRKLKLYFENLVLVMLLFMCANMIVPYSRRTMKMMIIAQFVVNQDGK